MSYNFLELVNDVNRRLNEVPLTSSNFSDATGYYADAKSYVNGSLNRINRQEVEWPFNHTSQTQLLTVDVIQYSYPSDAKSIAFDTFRVQGEEALNVESRKLDILDYEEYIDKYVDYEFNPSDYSDSPRMVTRNRNLSYNILPPPDQAYTVKFDYYRVPPELSAYDDVPTVPEQFKWLINEGAMYYAYMFRGDLESATLSDDKFKEGLKDMRKIYINRTEYVRTGVVNF